MLQGSRRSPVEGSFLIPLSFCIASIRFISSLQVVNIVSVCLRGHRGQTINFTLYLCSIPEARSYFNIPPITFKDGLEVSRFYLGFPQNKKSIYGRIS